MSIFCRAAVVFCVVAASGCTSSLYSTRTPTPVVVNASKSSTPADTAREPTPQETQAVTAELQQLAATDPAGHDRLAEDLRQSDPSLWPLVVQQFHATAAYRRRMAEETAVAAVERIPPTTSAASTATAADTTSQPTVDPPSSDEPSGQVTQTVYAAPAASDWRQLLDDAIRQLEAETPSDPATPAQVSQHARLRMLYAAAGRRDDAVRPIPAQPPAAQQFLAKELDGLTMWLNAEQTPDTSRRAAATQTVLAEAVGKLGEAAPLAVRNLAFCTEVRSYGCMKRFEKYEFQPGQEVLLYAEVENFVSSQTVKGYHTSLKSSYQVFDARGRRVAESSLAATEEDCQNVRRDFFIGYDFHLPKTLESGKHRLQLSVEDIQGKKLGQASIEFDVKNENNARQSVSDPDRRP